MSAPGTDVVVVGGGPAGITTALTLQRLAPSLAARVVVLEKGVYPREKYCAGGLGGLGDSVLQRLDAVPDVPSVPVTGMSLRTSFGERAVRPGGTIGRVIRRLEFDHALAKIAMARGIAVRDDVRVDSVRRMGRNAIVETTIGTLEAKVVVGCDGVGSIVRKAMGLGAGRLKAQVLEVDTEPVSDERPRDLLHFDASDPSLVGYTWDFPTLVEGRPLVCRGIYRLQFPDDDRAPSVDKGRDIGEMLGDRLAAMGLDLARCKNKRFAERGYEPSSRVVDGPMMLVGEAAGIDPITGEGIAQAIEYGWLAGSFLANALTTQRPLEGWQEAFDHSRLARDLHVRSWLVRMFYGPDRERTERFLVERPLALHLGSQHFGGLPLDRVRFAELLLRGGGFLLGNWARRTLD